MYKIFNFKYPLKFENNNTFSPLGKKNVPSYYIKPEFEA